MTDIVGPAEGCSEAVFQAAVEDVADHFGWRRMHVAPTRSGRSWRTATTGDPGFPDLVLARDGVVLLVELKKDRGGRFRPGQREWLEQAGAHGRLWKPRDWATIIEELA